MAVVAALAVRVWWVRPGELDPGPLLASARLQGGDYRLVPKMSVGTRALIRAEFFEGYNPEHHFEFEETVKDRPSRYVTEDSHHHYTEYVGRFGRIQLHSAYDREDGISEWFEFFPASMAVDEFFVPEVAIILDPKRDKFSVYIPNGHEHSYLTVRAAGGRIVKVAWLTWYGRADD
ncbi:MAG TPA: hypothetical protein VFE48_22295 [Methylomirabilota bacterium]|nr:hypothetical protein [Methylomirabilota bacterium]